MRLRSIRSANGRLRFRFGQIKSNFSRFLRFTDAFNRLYGEAKLKEIGRYRQSMVGSEHAIASTLEQVQKRRFAIGPVQGERRILRRATDVTHGSSSAGNKNAARREKGDTMETQRVSDWAMSTSGRGIASLSSAPLQLAAAAVYQPPRCNLIRALSHERTESALQPGPLLLSTPPLFPPPTFPLFLLPLVYILLPRSVGHCILLNLR